MRMWMVDPKLMCKDHLLGEHRELHAILGILDKKMSISGYIDNNLIQPLSIGERHSAIIEEMRSRGYNHNSPIYFDPASLSYLPEAEQMYIIKANYSAQDLVARCPECAKRFKEAIK